MKPKNRGLLFKGKNLLGKTNTLTAVDKDVFSHNHSNAKLGEMVFEVVHKSNWSLTSFYYVF